MNSTDNETCLFLEVLFIAQVSPAVHYTALFTSIINGLTSLSAILGNSVMLYVFLKTRTLQTPSNMLLGSLCITDLIVGLIVQPLGIVRRIIEANKQHNCPVRIVYACFGFLCSGASFLNVGLISVDRCLALHMPFRYMRIASNSRHLIIISLVWLFWAVFTVLPFCSVLSASSFFSVVVGVLGINVLVILVCYALIARMVLQLKRTFVAATSLGALDTSADTMPGSSGVGKSSTVSAASALKASDDDHKKAEKRHNYTIFIVVACFVVCYIPQMTVLFLRSAFGDNVSLVFIADAWVDTLTFINSSLNPIIYCLRSNEIRRHVLRSLGVRRTSVVPANHMA